MKRCWIHIGMHKTGSTSVQVNLAAVKHPADWSILTVGGGPNMGQALHAMFAKDPHKFHWFAKRGNKADEVSQKGLHLRKKLAQAIRKCPKENVIISAEALSLIDKPAVLALRDFLQPFFDEIRIVGYVRPPIGFINSNFQQKVKHGKGAFDLGSVKPRYIRRFEKYDEIFGRENVILRKFDPASFPNKCIVADFCAVIGINPPDPASIRRVNESLTREACGILYAYRKFGPGYGVGENVIKENSRIISPLFAMKGAKFRVSNSIMAPAIEALGKDIRWMEKRLGVSLKESIVEDGSEVASEDELLTIRRSSCEEFAARFSELYGFAIPPETIPSGDPVDPRRVAEFIEYCRGLCRERLLSKGGASSRKSIVARLLGWLRKPVVPGAPQNGPA